MENVNITVSESASRYFDKMVYEFYKKDTKNKEFFQQSIYEILSLLIDDSVRKPKDITFWYGYTGILYLLDYFHKQGLMKGGCFDKYTRYLCDSIDNIYLTDKIGNHRWYDLFYGVTGISLYLFYHVDEPHVYRKLEDVAYYFFEQIDKLIAKEKDTRLFIKPENYIDKNLRQVFKYGYIDLGVAHGLLSIIYFLKEMFILSKKDIYFQYVKKLIRFYEEILFGKQENYIIRDAKYGFSLDKSFDIYPKWGNSVFSILVYLIVYTKELEMMEEYSKFVEEYYRYNISMEKLPKNITLANGMSGILILLKYVNMILKDKKHYEIIKEIENIMDASNHIYKQNIMTGIYGINIARNITYNEVSLIHSLLLLR